MLTIIQNHLQNALFASFAKKDGGVDKGTTRKTPGDSGGARPPKEEDYEKIKRDKNNPKADPKTEKVDNEEKDKNKE